MMWWIDAGAGASGDMLLGALLDLDPDGLQPAQAAVDEVLQRLGGDGCVKLSTRNVTRAGMAARQAVVEPSSSTTRRTWRQIAPALEGFPVAHRAFSYLAQAEAAVHGVSEDEVHFHEVGALDAIADIVAVTTLLGRLAPQEVVVSPVCVGAGSVDTEHGTLSVPVPAVVRLLEGVPTFGGPVAHEACTPTGAALLRTMATSWGPQPLMAVSTTGVGAGGRDLSGVANVVRVLIGAGESASETLAMVETTIDDLDPRIYPHVIEATKQAGALETWLTPVIMKHGRPATVLTSLTPPAAIQPVTEVILRETNTLGVRSWPVARTALRRDSVTVEVRGFPLSVKRGWLNGVVVTSQPEYSDAAAVAGQTGVPVKQIIDEARSAANDAGNKKGSDATDGGDSDVRTNRN